MPEMMVDFIIRISNTAQTLTNKILFQIFMVIVLCESQKMWKEGSKIFEYR